MASRALELRPQARTASPYGLLESVTVRCRDGVNMAACALARAVEQHGLCFMGWHDLATMQPMVDETGQPLNSTVFGWPEQVLEPWLNINKALRSPVLRACRVASEPFWISRRGIRTGCRNRFFDSIKLESCEEWLLGTAAIVMPIRLPFGQLAAAILTSNDLAKEDLSDEFDHFNRTLALAVHRFVRSYVTVSCDERYLPTDTSLTKREIECLSWAAQGKTDYEIAMILGCSHAGVRYHITKVCVKLNATNRAQSVFKACQLGYLSAPIGN